MKQGHCAKLEYQEACIYIAPIANPIRSSLNPVFPVIPTIRNLAVMFFVVLATAGAQTYGTSSHTVTVQVSQVTLIQISASSVGLTISGANAVAGQDAMSVSDQSTTLLWGTNVSQRKVTAQTNLAGPIFALKVLAVNPTQGTAAPEVTLSTTAQDFLTNIGKSSGTTQLQYTGVALASQGTGSDAHTLTFTVTVQ